ncbi:hypothetical protein SBI_00569 [Streptomyces bingchenggensis BCW-1]|uniref:Uncharacterized protein n=2 Tax=Streptomyces TaxID=1883 RepID=D7C0J9_STRBB|nr:hypothetical protein [Streptomyces bingchenggensis]ADI03690.1 hypothetical protein SBI_00569 [Streptomyces bingchenggensis BCW-1]
MSHDLITGPVNGDDSLHNPGGSESHIDSHGRVVTEYPDGHTTTIDPDNQTSSITTPDGHTRSGPLNVDNVLNNPDGSRSHIDPQGQVVTEYPDGSKTTIDPDTGGTSITDPDGKSVTGHLNGSGNSLPDFQQQSPGSNFGNIGGGGSGNSNSLYDPSSYEEELWDKDPYQSPGDQNGNGNNQAAANAGNQNQSGAPMGGGMPLNPGTMPGRGGGGGGGEGGPSERVRNVIDSGDVVSNRRATPRPGRPGGGLLDERENVITSGGTPFMPPMGGAGGAGSPGQVATQTDDRERESWVPEDEDVWGSDEGGSPAVIGR